MKVDTMPQAIGYETAKPTINATEYRTRSLTLASDNTMETGDSGPEGGDPELLKDKEISDSPLQLLRKKL